MRIKRTLHRFPVALGIAGVAAMGNQSANAADTDSLTLEEVTVTAEKRIQNLQEVPATVSVVRSDDLNSLHATQLADIGAYVPGLQVDSFGAPGQTILSVRGISPLSANATVASYIDETPIGSTGFHDRGGNYALDLLPFDVRQIEVLSGPQGTLYGANALGGLIKYDLTIPNLDKSEYRVGASVFDVSHGTGTGNGLRGYVNTPLVTDKLGLIASVGQERKPGFIDNFATGRKGQNWTSQRSARAGLLWQITDAAIFQLNGLYAKTETDGVATVALDPVTMRPLAGDLTDNNLRPNAYDNELNYVSATLNWQLSFADFVSATSWSKKSDTVIQDATYTYQPLLPLLGGPDDGAIAFPLLLSAKRFSQEFRLASTGGSAFDWLAGLYYDHEKGTNRQFLRTYRADGTSLADLGIDPLFEASLPTTYREYAAFANGTFHASDRLEFGAGVRYARNEQDFSQIVEDGSPILPPSNIPGDSAENVVTWTARSNFKFTPDNMAYVLVSTGYQAGGPNTTLPGVPPSVDSSRLTNYEIGFKNTFFEGRAVANIAAFELRWRKIQVPGALPSGISYVANGGTARSRGLQLDTSIKAAEGLEFRASASYIDAILTEDAPTANGADGDQLPLVPKFAGSLRADYERNAFADWTFHVGAGLRHVGKRFSVGLLALDGIQTDAYDAVDLNADLSDENWTIRLFARNVTDKRAYLTAFTFPDLSGASAIQTQGIVLEPRTVGLTLEYKF
jgi:outer membrane receptor protein involved in Fe transport